METLYEKYENIQLFATKYRGFKLLDEKFYTYDEFKNNMQVYEYILNKFHNPKTNKSVDIFLLSSTSKYIKDTKNFKKILDKYTDEAHIIMITKEELSIYCRKALKKYPNIFLKNYYHKHFIIELNRGTLCSKHTILTPEEVRKVCYGGMFHGHKLPSISEFDPQNIWIGAEINDIIKIESISEITGNVIKYRIVTPISGKVLQSSIIKSNDKVAKKITSSDPKDDDMIDDGNIESDND
jgi:DNA-directed RNA polymerase subunit H (RpoH/RPB5)